MTENEVAKQIVDVAFKIHSTYGPGLLDLFTRQSWLTSLISEAFASIANRQYR
jgi:hypothetical protein